MDLSSFILGQVRKDSVNYLRKQGVNSPELSADVLLAHALGISKLDLILRAEYKLGIQEIARIKEVVMRRAQGEPVAYILGKKEFFGLDFYVTSQVLIPRPETEEIIDLIKTIFKPRAKFLFADIGTGSGAIAITLLNEFPYCQGILSDISWSALKLAANNAHIYAAQNTYLVVQSDLATSLKPSQYDLIVSNPPYLTEADFDKLSVEVSAYEPRQALIAGQNRSDMHIPIARHAYRCLKPGGWLIMEIDCRQKILKYDLFDKMPQMWQDSFVYRDYSGLDRIVGARKCAKNTRSVS